MQDTDRVLMTELPVPIGSNHEKMSVVSCCKNLFSNSDCGFDNVNINTATTSFPFRRFSPGQQGLATRQRPSFPAEGGCSGPGTSHLSGVVQHVWIQ